MPKQFIYKNVFNNYLTTGGYNANTEITDEKVLHLSKKFEKEMNDAGVYSTSINKYTIDEAPECYKDTELIKQLVQPSVEILDHLKPILNIKG